MENPSEEPMTKSVHDFSAATIEGREQSLAGYAGTVLLIVNTASQCGFTPQYADLELLYQQFKDRGFEVLGFPCNQFGAQEPGAEDEIKQFCEVRFGVTFPLFAKVDVNGSEAHPLFRYLKESARGLLGSRDIKWNFTKFLVDARGQVVERYAPSTAPRSIAKDIERLLAEPV
jgi:glutathione peroxidase